jgi:hypothetical protein
MSKMILSMFVAALFCVAGSAKADNGISASTLDKMGLSGLTVVSDNDAMSIRGMGYTGSKTSWMSKSRRDKQPWSAAFGNSFATVHDQEGNVAHSENGYSAEGPYEADGENFSEATLSTIDTEQVDFGDGTIKNVTNIWTIHVEAGGFSSAKSF